MRIVQPGKGDVRDVVLVYHLSSAVDAALRAAAPSACIGNETGPAFKGFYSGTGPGRIAPLADALEDLRRRIGRFNVGRIIVVGYSEGCQASRTHLRAGADPDAIVAADGTHASL